MSQEPLQRGETAPAPVRQMGVSPPAHRAAPYTREKSPWQTIVGIVPSPDSALPTSALRCARPAGSRRTTG